MRFHWNCGLYRGAGRAAFIKVCIQAFAAYVRCGLQSPYYDIGLWLTNVGMLVCMVINLFAVEVGVSSEGAPGSGEGEHGERDWDGNIHSDLQDKQKVQHHTLYFIPLQNIRYNLKHR